MSRSLHSIMFDAAFRQFTTDTRIKPKPRARWRCGPITFVPRRGWRAQNSVAAAGVSRMRQGRRDDNEIVADIIKLTGCRGIKLLVDGRDDRDLTELYVRKLIEWLRTELPPFTGNREQNRKFATGLREQINKLEHTLERAPAIFGDRFWSLSRFQGTPMELNPPPPNYIEQDPGLRLKRF